VAKKHDYKALPDGSQQCKKCGDLRIIGVIRLVYPIDCPWAVDEVKQKEANNTGYSKTEHHDVLGDMGIIIPGVNDDPSLMPKPGTKISGGKGESKESGGYDYLGDLGIEIPGLND
jgi:hypothetical protein